MNDKFFDLKKEKQDRMINGALKIFALNGYQKASTDDIVKEAGISKGLLFHYFGSKAGLYVFVYEYSARYMSMELQRAVSLRERDLFRLLSQVEDAKNVLLRNYPYMQKFLLTHEDVQDREIQKAIEGFTDLVPKAMDEVVERADFDRIEPDVDRAFLVRSMNYVTRGLMETALTDKMDAEDVYKEAKAFYEMMRIKFTKKEYLEEDES
ncbi:MAG: TetR/AcrR family transcriptional regulator [Lachnospiraceae bacterium]|nr:TetR/AcrR family transcriptional regulator [Lachnospiraceae bacterium]